MGFYITFIFIIQASAYIILQLESLTVPASVLARTSDLDPASDKTVTSSGLVCKAASQPLLTSLAVVWIPILVFTLITGKTPVYVCEEYIILLAGQAV